MSQQRKESPHSDDQPEYIGNIWGWKFSLISLAIILATMALMVLRYYTMDNPPDSIFFFPQSPPDTMRVDTLME